MVEDERVCLGCGKKVLNLLRGKLVKQGWTFIEVIGDEAVTYYSNCGCLPHDKFVELVKESEAK